MKVNVSANQSNTLNLRAAVHIVLLSSFFRRTINVMPFKTPCILLEFESLYEYMVANYVQESQHFLLNADSYGAMALAVVAYENSFVRCYSLACISDSFRPCLCVQSLLITLACLNHVQTLSHHFFET